MIENPDFIYVVVTFDQGYLPHAATMLYSLLQNTTAPIKVILFHDGIPSEKLIILSSFLNKNKALFEDYEIHDSVLSSLVVKHHFKHINYFRLLIPEILPKSISKVLYLDVDMIIRKPIEVLWNTDISDSLFGAVEEEQFSPQYKAKLGMAPDSAYFNSGVLLINVEEWRKQSFHLKVINFIKDNPEKIEYQDQDGLNAVANGQWIKLPLDWNTTHHNIYQPQNRIRYADIISDPSIVHFTGTGLKPWQYNKFKHPYTLEYIKFREKTPWPEMELENLPHKSNKNQIKKILKKIFVTLGKINLFWKANEYFYRLSSYVYFSRKKLKPSFNSPNIESNDMELEPVFQKSVVLSGPFKGLKYPHLEAIGSTLSPKLLGTYEIELASIIEEICYLKYSTIIDIGCAEGYYAVGLALRKSESIIYAYDINPNARFLCESMAKANGVEGRVIVKDIFTMRSVGNIPVVDQGILICDCEGAEEYIFYKDGDNWDYLIHNFDILMEIHDVLRPGISIYIYELFSDSHDIQIIYSVNDQLRPTLYDAPALSNLSMDKKIELMAEYRPGVMQWFYMKRKNISHRTV